MQLNTIKVVEINTFYNTAIKVKIEVCLFFNFNFTFGKNKQIL